MKKPNFNYLISLSLLAGLLLPLPVLSASRQKVLTGGVKESVSQPQPRLEEIPRPSSTQPQAKTTPKQATQQATISKKTVVAPVAPAPTSIAPVPSESSGAKGIVGLDMTVPPLGYPVIRGVFPGSPAEQAGISSGDVILAINGDSSFNKSRDQLDLEISDIPGTPVLFTLQHANEIRTLKVTVLSLNDASPALLGRYIMTD